MKKISELMSKNLVFTNPGSSLKEVARLMLDGDCGEIPLVQDSESMKIVGVITDRDIVCRSLAVDKDPMKLKAQDIMTSPAVTCSEDQDIEECLKLMEEKKIRRLPIVDREQKLCGIISQADLARSVSGEDSSEFLREVSRPSDSASQVTH